MRWDPHLNFKAGGQEHTQWIAPGFSRCQSSPFAVIVPLLRRRPLLFEMRPFLFYLLLAGAAAGGASKTPVRANASIATFQFPFSRFSILNQLPWMVLSLTVTE